MGNVKPCRGPCYGQDLYHHVKNMRGSEAELLDEIHTKVLRVFLLAIHSHLYSFALRLLFIHTHATSTVSSIQLVYTVKEKGGKPDRKPNLLP